MQTSNVSSTGISPQIEKIAGSKTHLTPVTAMKGGEKRKLTANSKNRVWSSTPINKWRCMDTSLVSPEPLKGILLHAQ